MGDLDYSIFINVTLCIDVFSGTNKLQNACANLRPRKLRVATSFIIYNADMRNDNPRKIIRNIFIILSHVPISFINPLCCPFFFCSSHHLPSISLTLHRHPTGNEVPVSAPGSYAKPGTTYMLVKDITSATSTIFLGKDVTLDLNGYTIKYADGNYGHIFNSGFEEGEKGWDLSKAPGAKVVNTKDVHVFIGKKILSLKAGDEITSSYVNLPLANRSYFAMCGVTGSDYHDMGGDLNNQMKVSVYVEDEHGKEVRMCYKIWRHHIG